MPATLTNTGLDLLPPAKTTGTRSLKWVATPECGHIAGVLEITDRKTTRHYAVRPFNPDSGFDGLAYEVTKSDGTVYHCFLAADGHNHHCDCAAATYGRVAECVHVAALKTLLANGWLNG